MEEMLVLDLTASLVFIFPDVIYVLISTGSLVLHMLSYGRASSPFLNHLYKISVICDANSTLM